MTTTQTYVDCRTVRDLATDLGVECDVTTRDGEIVIEFAATGEEDSFATLEGAAEAIREYAKH